MLSFSFISKYFLISIVISSSIHWFVKSVPFNFHKVINFPVSFCYWFLTLSLCGQRRYLVWHLSFYIYWDLNCSLTYDLSWRMFHVHLRRMFILLLLGKVLCVSLLDLVGLLHCLSSLFPYLSYVWWFYSLLRVGCWIPYYCRNICLSLLFFIFCFKYFDGMVLVI